MAVSDAWIGQALLATTVAVFLLVTGWVNTYPFLDEESVFYSYIPDPKWWLLACAAWGTCFIGGLMAFTLYHIYPHLKSTRT